MGLLEAKGDLCIFFPLARLKWATSQARADTGNPEEEATERRAVLPSSSTSTRTQGFSETAELVSSEDQVLPAWPWGCLETHLSSDQQFRRKPSERLGSPSQPPCCGTRRNWVVPSLLNGFCDVFTTHGIPVAE